MKNINLDKSYFDNIFGLSCVENLLLYILNSQDYSYKYLYYDSYIPLNRIIESFISKKESYANFTQISRIQDTAKNHGLIAQNNYNKFCDIPCEEDAWVCVMVKPEYIRFKYSVNLLRNDHFVLLADKTSAGYVFVNDTPRDFGLITTDELPMINDNIAISFSIIKDVDDYLKDEFYTKMIEQLSIDNFDTISNFTTCGDIYIIRDIVGIYKIIQRRLYNFISLYGDVEFMQENIEAIEKLYSAIEYMRLRNRIDYAGINEKLSNIYLQDKENIKRIIQLK